MSDMYGYKPSQGRITMFPPQTDLQWKATRPIGVDENTGERIWPVVVPAPNQCALCSQYTPGTERHVAFGKVVYVHPLCLADLHRKYGNASHQTGQETPMGKSLVSKAGQRPISKACPIMPPEPTPQEIFRLLRKYDIR